MDYTTLALVQAQMGSDGINYTGANPLLSQNITTASNIIDVITSGGHIDAVGYLVLETKTETLHNGIVNNVGSLVVYPHKPLIASVASLQWRISPRDPWNIADMTMVDVDDKSVKLWESGANQGRATVQITYSGGLSSSQSGMPAGIVQVANELAVRMYKEAKSGLTDVVGVADTGILFYQKAIPLTTQAKLNPYLRVVPW